MKMKKALLLSGLFLASHVISVDEKPQEYQNPYEVEMTSAGMTAFLNLVKIIPSPVLSTSLLTVSSLGFGACAMMREFKNNSFLGLHLDMHTQHEGDLTDFEKEEKRIANTLTDSINMAKDTLRKTSPSLSLPEADLDTSIVEKIVPNVVATAVFNAVPLCLVFGGFALRRQSKFVSYAGAGSFYYAALRMIKNNEEEMPKYQKRFGPTIATPAVKRQVLKEKFDDFNNIPAVKGCRDFMVNDSTKK